MPELPPKNNTNKLLETNQKNIEEKIAYLEDAINILENKLLAGAKIEETKLEIRKLQKEKAENQVELQKIKEQLQA